MLLLLSLQSQIAYALPYLTAFQERYHMLPDEQGDDERQEDGQHGPEGDELQQSTPREFDALICKPVEQLIEHGLYLSGDLPIVLSLYFSSILNISSSTCRSSKAMRTPLVS